MPNCFRLVDKKTGTAEKLSTVDEELCAFMGIPVNEARWCCDWYNTIGYELALGYTWERIRENYKDRPVVLKIASWLEERYVAEAWYERGKW